MDDESSGFEEFRGCLRDISRLNGLTLAHRPTLGFLDRLLASGMLSERCLSIVDVGCGDGDMLRRIDRWAARRGVAVKLTGVDLNPWAAHAAAEATPPGRPIRWITSDVFAYHPEDGIDLVVSSVFAHHLDDTAVARFLDWMEVNARLGWFVNDLHRHLLPYLLLRLSLRPIGFHHFVQYDAPVSVTRAFAPADWRQLIVAAGLDPKTVDVNWWMPFRLCVSRIKHLILEPRR
jgi:SAM-dependent methyltransferase